MLGALSENMSILPVKKTVGDLARAIPPSDMDTDEPSKALVKAVKLGRVFARDEVETTALSNVQLEVNTGDFLVIMGPSGCGKSTLLQIMGLLDEPSSGSLYFLGEDMAKASQRRKAWLRRQYIGFVFQSFNLIDDLTLRENIELPLAYLKVGRKERGKRVMALMEQLNIQHKADYFPVQVSGGQQQRAAVARAIVGKPRLLLADEPTGNLNSEQGLEVMQMLSDLHSQGTTVVVVTHSSEITQYANRKIHLFDGHIVVGAS